MTPTPEQVAQWAREAGGAEFAGMVLRCWPEQLRRLVTRAMAEQAEADAKLCGARKAQSRNSLVRSGIEVVAGDIRASAPKVTT